MAERLGNWASNQKVAGSILAVYNDFVSFTLLASGGNVPVLTVSRSG